MSEDSIDPVEFNQAKWDAIARANDRWFKGVTQEQIEAARNGEWRINVTAQKAVPREWLEPLSGKRILCLAGAGGKQAPILAALGAEVTVFDISQEQLERDRQIANREQLGLQVIQGDMTNLEMFEDGSFELVLNPCSVCYTPSVRAVWQESCRVLEPGGALVSGMINPLNYLFDESAKDKGKLVARHRIPYSDLDLPAEERKELMGSDRPVDFGHTMTDLIGGLLDSGFRLTGFFEDRWGGGDKLSRHIDVFFAIHATKC